MMVHGLGIFQFLLKNLCGSPCAKGSEQEGHQRHGEGNWEVTDNLRLRSIGHVDLVELRKQHRRPG